MLSAKEKAEVVHEYLLTEVSAGHVLGPLDTAEYSQLDYLALFLTVIPRLTVDIPSPEGVSVNDGMKKSLCCLSYMTIMDATKVVAAFGRGH